MDLPYAEIAMTLGISVNSVKTHLRRGMRGLIFVQGSQADLDNCDGYVNG